MQYKVSKGAKIRNRYNQVPHLTLDTNGKVTNSQLDTTNSTNPFFVFQVMWQALYSTSSARDIGTIFAARNIVNAKNVTKDPGGNYYASATMADKFTKAYITVGGLKHFGMDSTSEEPKNNLYSGGIGNKDEMRKYILQQARAFVEEFVCIDVDPLPNYGPQSIAQICRFCQLDFGKQVQRLRKHEHTVHGQPDPKYDEGTGKPQETIRKSKPNTEEDMVLEYTKLSLTLGLLRLNHNDAINLGDGGRIMLVNQYLYLLYRNFGCPKYAFGILETICQAKILLSERLAHRLTWNRCVNHRGKVDTNHPNDLDLEHCNKIFKDEAHSFRGVFTEKTVSRVSRSAVCTQNVLLNFDRETNTRTGSGLHSECDLSQDVGLIVNQLTTHQVFDNIPGRSHQSFANVRANPFKQNMEEVRDWIFRSMKKYAAKHFY